MSNFLKTTGLSTSLRSI